MLLGGGGPAVLLFELVRPHVAARPLWADDITLVGRVGVATAGLARSDLINGRASGE